MCTRTILNVFNSSLICWANKGVRRLHVAISPRLSYSPLGQVSWKVMRGLKLTLNFEPELGDAGALWELTFNFGGIMK